MNNPEQEQVQLPDEELVAEEMEETPSANSPSFFFRLKEHFRTKFLRRLAIFLVVILSLEGIYCFLMFSNIPVIKHYREAFIETALSTLSHQWIAYDFFPKYMVENVQLRMDAARLAQEGLESDQSVRFSEEDVPTLNNPKNPDNNPSGQIDIDLTEDAKKDAFYELFWELNRTSFEEYLDEHPSVLDHGWNNIYINEAGFDDDGTSIYTTMGEQVLAIDAKNKILLVRVQDTGYIGILAICKDPSQLRVEASSAIGSYGQTVGDLVDESDGILGITGSGFYDPGGGGSGGVLAGYTMCEGKSYGEHYGGLGYKRIELTNKNKMYIVDAGDSVASDVTDAVEFYPALIIDGQVLISEDNTWLSINPRACIGQSEKDEYLMLVIEGRQTGRSIGADLVSCASIMKRHGGYTALNLDGGTSAVMYYDGEYVTKCSNRKIYSRTLPNAWVYGGYED